MKLRVFRDESHVVVQPAMGGFAMEGDFSFSFRPAFTTAGNSESLTVSPEKSLTRASS